MAMNRTVERLECSKDARNPARFTFPLERINN